TIQRILDTFDLYNFTVREDEPLDKEVAVDPEMLGKVFENLLEVKDRKSKGAFYTPREIVHYMCQESLINYLDTTINRQSVEIARPQTQQTSLFETSTSGQVPLTQEEYCERVPRGDLERLIRQGERAIENDAVVVQKGSETQTYQFQVPESVRTYAADIDRALADIKICDPAIGSGAFPVGMMQEIVKVRGVLTTYLALTPSPNPLPNRERASGSPPSPHLGEGGRGDEGRTAYAFKRHAIQSSIYGVDIDPGAVDIAKLRLWLSLVVDEEDYTRIKPLPNLDYKIVCGNSLLGVDQRGDVKQYQGNVLNYQQLEQLDQLMLDFFDETNSERKTQLNRDIKSLIQTLTGSAETFDFRIYFSEVFRKNHGFDVVIGNPPYVRQEKLGNEAKQALKANFPELYKGTADIYTYFYGKGVSLLKERGSLAYITSNKWFRANYGVPLRHYMATHCQIKHIIDFGELPVFEAATFPMILIAQRGKVTDTVTCFTPVKSLNPPYPDLPALIDQYGQSLPKSAIRGSDWVLASSDSAAILNKMQQIGIPLGEYINGQLYRGVVTGFNKAFVISGTKRTELITQDPKSAEIIKPLVVGDDVRKWHIRRKDTWLIFTRRGIDINQYPA
ncbi:MAG: Eco57I restriction-modification methylase domain-containing protein, partial [Kovacikia sp.]